MSENTTTTPRPYRVTLFASCMVDQLAPDVGESTVEVLEYLGVTVDFLDDQTYCGQPAFNSGFRSEAYPVAERFIEGTIVTGIHRPLEVHLIILANG